MKTKEIKYRLGKTKYDFDESKPWSDLDQQLADHIAKEAILMEDAIDFAQGTSDQASVLTKEIRARLKYLEEEVIVKLTAAREKVDRYIPELELGNPKLGVELSDLINAANDAIQEQNVEIRKIHPTYLDLIERIVKASDDEEANGDVLMDEFSALFARAAKDDGISTDLVSYDRAIEALRVVQQFQMGRIKELISYANEVVTDFNMLSAKTEWRQDIWIELCARMVLVEYCGKLYYGNQGISNN